MKKLLCFVVLYFGRLPVNMPLFLKTCKDNPEYNWLLFTDDTTKYEYPENVEVKYCTFEDIQTRVQSCFDFEISLEYPKRLCSFKPAYGYIFEEELRGYEYWGYCDLDQVFGKIDVFVPGEKIRQYDKLYHLGHLTIYRNDKEINSVFKSESDAPGLEVRSYKEIFKGLDIVFDEWDDKSVTVNTLFEEKGLNVYYADDYCDIEPFKSGYSENLFFIDTRCWGSSEDSNFVIVVKDGRLYKVLYDKKQKNFTYSERLYAHFQKRRFSVKLNSDNECFVIYNNKMRSFVKSEEVEVLKKAFRAVKMRTFFKADETVCFLKKIKESMKVYIYKKLFEKQ